MSNVTAGETCRLVVEGPTSRIDLSVPVGVPLGDLLPSVLHWLGDDLADHGLEHGGWVLQRLGEEPLDEDRTCAELSLHDGERLYLRPRSEHLPPLDFDDLVDGMATGAGRRAGLWTPRLTELTGDGVLVAGTALSWIGVLSLSPGGPTTLLAGLVPLVLLLACVLTAVVARSARTARVLGGLAVVSAVVAPYALAGAPDLASWGWAQVAVAGWAGLVLIGSAVAVRRSSLVPVSVFVLLLSALLAAAAVLRDHPGLTTTQVAALLAAVLLLARGGVAVASFRLAGLRLPPLPQSTEDIQRDIDPEPGDTVIAAAARTDALMTALLGAGAVVLSLALARLVAGGTLTGELLGTAVAINLVLSTRPLTSGWHRAASVLPAVVVVAVAVRHPASPLVTGVLSLVLLCAGLLGPVLARAVLRRPVGPRLGRLGDLVQTLSLVVAGPLAVLALGLTDLVRRSVS